MRRAFGLATAVLAVAVTVLALPVAGSAAEPDPPPVDRGALPAQFAPPSASDARQVAACVGSSTNAAPTGGAQPWAPRRLRLPQAWRFGGGKGQRIAVIDTGVSPHPRLAGRLVGGGDYVAGGDGLLDCDGHGTLVAGIAAAASGQAGDEFGGAAPQAEVISIRQTSAAFAVAGGPGGARTAGDTATLARAVLQAVALRADVINISEVACVPAPTAGKVARDLQAAVRTAVDHGVVVVAAAGNVGAGGCGAQNDSRADTVVLPAWFDADVLTVGSVGPDGAASGFSMRGPWVDVAAPGAELVSLDPAGRGLTASHGTDSGVQGTSFAAPAVAGLVALVRQRFPSLTPRQVIDRVTATAQRAGTGRDAAVGYGMVDPLAALTVEPTILPPPTRVAADRRLTGELAPSVIPAAAQPAATATGIGAATLAVMLGCVIAAVHRVRRSLAQPPGRGRLNPERPPVRPPSDGPLPGPAVARSGAAAAPPPGRASRL